MVEWICFSLRADGKKYVLISFGQQKKLKESPFDVDGEFSHAISNRGYEEPFKELLLLFFPHEFLWAGGKRFF